MLGVGRSHAKVRSREGRKRDWVGEIGLAGMAVGGSLGLSKTTYPSCIMDNISDPVNVSQRRLHRGWSALLIFVVAMLASAVLRWRDGMVLEFSVGCFAEILGGAIVLLLVGLFGLSFRGKTAAWVGIVLVGAVAYVSYLGQEEGNRPKREAVQQMQRDKEAIAIAARQSYQKTGLTNVDPLLVRQLLKDISENASLVDGDAKGASDSLVEVMTEYVDRSEVMRKVMTEIATNDFMTVRENDSPKTIDQRLKKLEAMHSAVNELQVYVRDIDVRLKGSLARRNLAPLVIKAITDRFVQKMQWDVVQEILRVNLRNAEAHTRRFEILKEQWGKWKLRESTVYFEDPIALQEWNDLGRTLFELTERRSVLDQQVLMKL